jgi:hypothetical protein
MKLSKEESLTVLACLLGMIIMTAEHNYGNSEEKSTILLLLIIPVLMLLYVRYLLKKQKK